MRLKDFISTVLPPIVWIGIIYIASSQPYEQQDLRPFLRDIDLSWVERSFSWVSFVYSDTIVSIENRGVAGFVEFFIRKGAHVFVFFVLGFLIFRAVKFVRINLVLTVLISTIMIAVFAGIDEYRHLQNPGRTGLIEDVILDTVGGFLGIVVGVIFHFYKIRRKK